METSFSWEEVVWNTLIWGHEHRFAVLTVAAIAWLSLWGFVLAPYIPKRSLRSKELEEIRHAPCLRRLPMEGRMNRRRLRTGLPGWTVACLVLPLVLVFGLVIANDAYVRGRASMSPATLPTRDPTKGGQPGATPVPSGSSQLLDYPFSMAEDVKEKKPCAGDPDGGDIYATGADELVLIAITKKDPVSPGLAQIVVPIVEIEGIIQIAIWQDGCVVMTPAWVPTQPTTPESDNETIM